MLSVVCKKLTQLFKVYFALLQLRGVTMTVQQPIDFETVFQKVSDTGIGYGGLSGVTWRMAGNGEKTFEISQKVFTHLKEVMVAVYNYNRILQNLTHNHPAKTLLSHKRPKKVRLTYGQNSLRLFRPDIVMFYGADGNINFKITEIESAPGGLGIFEAIRLAYAFKPNHKTVLELLRETIGENEFIVVMTHNWIDYIWDVCVAADWLRKKGVKVKVIIDRSKDDVQIFSTNLWRERQKNMPEYTSMQPNWQPHLVQRLQYYGFADFVEWHAELPQSVPHGTFVFRMGYHGSFRDSDTILKLVSWEKNCNATVLNSINTGLENKAIMATMDLMKKELKPSIDRDVFQLLKKHLAKTSLVDPFYCDMNKIFMNHKHHILKVAAWDEGDKLSWGARGIIDGAECTNRDWVREVGKALTEEHPIVIQERVTSITRTYRKTIGTDNVFRNLNRARIRWTPFVLIDNTGEVHIDLGIVTALDNFAAHGAVGAVMIPVTIID